MGVIRRHGLYAVVADTTVIPGITAMSGNTGTEVIGEATSGDLYPNQVSINAQNPGVTFSSRSIAIALSTIGLAGVNLADLAAGLIFWAHAHKTGASREGTLMHRKYVAAKGIVIPQQLTIDHQGNAVLSYLARPTWDGSNDPILITDLQTLTVSVADSERFTLGPCTIESYLTAQMKSLTIDFGINLSAEGSDSDVLPTFVSIATITPSITLQGTDIEWAKSANIPLFAGKAATHANTKLYLRKRAPGGKFVPDATAQHIMFTADGLAHIETFFEADGVTPAEITLEMPLRYDGTNSPLTVDTAIAIT